MILVIWPSTFTVFGPFSQLSSQQQSSEKQLFLCYPRRAGEHTDAFKQLKSPISLSRAKMSVNKCLHIVSVARRFSPKERCCIVKNKLSLDLFKAATINSFVANE